MASKTKRNPRTTAQPVEVPSIEVSSADVPSGEVPSAEVPSVEVPSTEAPSGELPSADKPAKTEKKCADDGDLCINPARVRAHLDRFNLNQLIDEQILEIKTELAKHDEASPEASTLKEKIAALSHERVRFSNDAPGVLAVVCDRVVRQLLCFAMDKTIANGKKNITVDVLHGEGVDKLSAYPLIKTLPLFIAKKARVDSRTIQEARKEEIAAALSQREHELQKQHKFKAERKKKSAGDKQEKEVEVEQSTKTSFKTYVKAVYASVHSEEKYAGLTLSYDLKNYLSEILVEFIKRMAQLVYLTTTVMKNKTVNRIAILKTVESLMIDMRQPVETITLEEVSECDSAGVTTKKWKANKVVTYPDSGYSELFDKL